VTVQPSRDAAHFQRLYDANPDPWGFRTSPYERAKYRHTVEALGHRHFRSGLEVGCSIGVLTRRLAPRCDRLLGIDLVERALEEARRTCADQTWVSFRRMQAPGAWPDGRFDLIVLSEVLYFLDRSDIAATARRVIESALPEAVVLLVNWLGRSDDPCTGEEAAKLFIGETADRFAVTLSRRCGGYRLDRLDRLDRAERPECASR
jgi:cyclopropane fatty-acyl-phospholipid synthase-like methyltransferase